MSQITFTEGTHSITIKRVQYTISDTVSFEESSTLKKSVKIDVEGWMKRTEIDSYKAWSYDGTDIKRNMSGTIMFSDDSGSDYMSIKDVYIMSIEETSETWREWGQVKVSFSNEGMATSDSSVVSFKGEVDIYNAQLSITPSVLRKNFYTVQTWNGSFCQKTGYDITRVVLNGIIPYDSCDFPEEIISKFERFIETEDKKLMIPEEGNLSDFISGIGGNLDIGNVFIESTSLVWNIERKVIQVNVSFVGPHQDVVKASS